jgi:hypothetical protein
VNATSVATSPGGDWVATGTHHGRGVRVWDARTREPREHLIREEPGVTPVFSPDGQGLVAVIPSAVRQWRVGSWELVRQVRPGQEPFSGAPAFSPDGRLLAVPLSLSGVQLRDRASGEVWAQLQAPDPGPVSLVGFSPDGSQLVVATATGVVGLWDLRRIREQLRELSLDWDLPPYPPSPAPGAVPPVPVNKVELVGYPLGLLPQQYLQRAHQSARLGRWGEAAADYDVALELEPGNDLTWHDASVLFLESGDIEGYRRACHEMLARFHQTTNPNIAERTVKTICLAPGGVEDYGPVRALAERAVTDTKAHGDYRWFLLARGMAGHRTGNCIDAIGWLRRSLSPGSERPYRDGLAHLFLAMAHHRLGQADESRHALALARAMEQRLPKPGDDLGNWPDWLRFHIVRREAEGLLIREGGS